MDFVVVAIAALGTCRRAPCLERVLDGKRNKSQMSTFIAKLKENGQELARSGDTEFVEGNYYFPPSSVGDVFSDSPTQYTCSWKGPAQYHNLAKGAQVKDIAWSYPETKPKAEYIRGYFAFDKSKVEVVKL